MRENKFQSCLIRKIKKLLPGSIVLKTDANYIQGFPDLLILFENRWAALECKQSANAPHRPNQEYYVSMLNTMSYAAFIFPENEEEVLRELQSALQSSR